MALRADMINGTFSPFNGELRSQDGVVRTENNSGLSSLDIIEMDWLCENVIGEIPGIDVLEDDAKTTVKVSGVQKSRSAVPAGKR